MATKIKQQDLKFFPSERLTDTDDGGGLRVGTPLTGEVNELFNPVSDVDRTLGGFDMRLIYAGVDRDDDEPLLGANTIIATPPADPSVSYLLMAAHRYGELRAEAASHVASYTTKSIQSRMTLLGTQSQNSNVILAYQTVGEPLPKVGEAYCLDQNKTGYPVAEQYVQITKATSEVRTFRENNEDFEKLVVTMEISQPLKSEFIGVAYPSRYHQTPPCLIKEVSVTDAARFFGCKKLAVQANQDDRSIKVEDIFEKIIPTTRAETPLINVDAGGVTAGYFDAAKTANDGIITYETNQPFEAGITFYTGMPITPGSLEIDAPGETLTDSNGTLLAAGTSVGTVNYGRGEATLSGDAPSYNGLKTIKFRPAGSPSKVSDSAMIIIDETNQAFNYTLTIDPAPSPGSLVLSYMSQGRWYDLRDNGSGLLSGYSDDYGSGSVMYNISTVTANLGALPDAGSAILLTWATESSCINRANITPPNPGITIDLNSETIVPTTLSITWNDGTTNQTATDTTAGEISGTGLSGKAFYLPPKLVLEHDILPPMGAEYEVSFMAGVKTEETKTPTTTATETIYDTGYTNIKPHTVNAAVYVTDDYYNSGTVKVRDDGAGNLVTDRDDGDGVKTYNVGGVDYTGGELAVQNDLLRMISLHDAPRPPLHIV